MLALPNRLAVGFDPKTGCYVLAALATDVQYYPPGFPKEDVLAYRISAGPDAPDFDGGAWRFAPFYDSRHKVTTNGGAYPIIGKIPRRTMGDGLLPTYDVEPVIYTVIHDGVFEHLGVFRLSKVSTDLDFVFRGPKDADSLYRPSLYPAPNSKFGSHRLACCLAREGQIVVEVNKLKKPNPSTTPPPDPKDPKPPEFIDVDLFLNNVFCVGRDGILQVYQEDPNAEVGVDNRTAGGLWKTEWRDFHAVQMAAIPPVKLDPASPIAACTSNSPFDSPIVAARTETGDLAVFYKKQSTTARGNDGFLNDWEVLVYKLPLRLALPDPNPDDDFRNQQELSFGEVPAPSSAPTVIGESIIAFRLEWDNASRFSDAFVLSTQSGQLFQVTITGEEKNGTVSIVGQVDQRLTVGMGLVDPHSDHLVGSRYLAPNNVAPGRHERIFARGAASPMQEWNCFLCQVSLAFGYSPKAAVHWAWITSSIPLRDNWDLGPPPGQYLGHVGFLERVELTNDFDFLVSVRRRLFLPGKGNPGGGGGGGAGWSVDVCQGFLRSIRVNAIKDVFDWTYFEQPYKK